MTQSPLQSNRPRVILGISGGIAAYKCGDLVRELRRRAIDVHVVMTKSAQAFVTPLTFQALSENPVHTDLFSLTEESEMGHIHLAETADLICIAPASANTIARLAHGFCDDLLTTLVSVSRAKKLLCPAMNVNMWDYSPTQKNLKTLREMGVHILEPEHGLLACGYEGKGRLPAPNAIADRILELLGDKTDGHPLSEPLSNLLSDPLSGPLSGKRILVTAGPTREFIDPFRFISNPSTGKMGIALATAARDLGADVTLLLGPSQIKEPDGMRCERFVSADDLFNLTVSHATTADVLVMAAAVSDYTPAQSASKKLKKTADPMALSLTPTRDILKHIGSQTQKPFLIGFAAETNDLVAYAKQKLLEKNCDLILANEIGTSKTSGFESDVNTLYIIDASLREVVLGPLSKDALAHQVWQIILPRLLPAT